MVQVSGDRPSVQRPSSITATACSSRGKANQSPSSGSAETKPAVVPPRGGDELGQLAGALETMREQLEGKAYVERYVQTLTHELKSPLTAIRAAAELLHEDMPPEDRRRFAARVSSPDDNDVRLFHDCFFTV